MCVCVWRGSWWSLIIQLHTCQISDKRERGGREGQQGGRKGESKQKKECGRKRRNSLTREGMQKKGGAGGLGKRTGESCIVVVVCEQAMTEESCRVSGQRQFCAIDTSDR